MVNPTNSGSSDVFDIRRVRRLVELMQENELTELDIQQGDMRIQLKRNAPMIGFPAAVPMPQAPVAMPVAAVTPASPVPPAPAAEEKNVQFIRSPMVGTFYAASSPESPAFAKVGDMVTPERTVCLIEAMKVYNEIQAECSGKILAVLVKNGASVEYGTPLFEVTND